MKNLILTFLIIILFFGCTKDNLSKYSSNLMGKWSWVCSCPGMGYSGCWFTDSIHKPYYISIEPDSTYNVFHNDTLTSSRRFKTFTESDVYGNIIAYFIKFESGVIDMYSISYDTLKIVNMEGMVIVSDRYIRTK